MNDSVFRSRERARHVIYEPRTPPIHNKFNPRACDLTIGEQACVASELAALTQKWLSQAD